MGPEIPVANPRSSFQLPDWKRVCRLPNLPGLLLFQSPQKGIVSGPDDRDQGPRVSRGDLHGGAELQRQRVDNARANPRSEVGVGRQTDTGVADGQHPAGAGRSVIDVDPAAPMAGKAVLEGV